jgi:hypothetical protein
MELDDKVALNQKSRKISGRGCTITFTRGRADRVVRIPQPFSSQYKIVLRPTGNKILLGYAEICPVPVITTPPARVIFQWRINADAAVQLSLKVAGSRSNIVLPAKKVNQSGRMGVKSPIKFQCASIIS